MAPSAEAVQTFPPRNPRRRQRKDMEEGGSLRQQPLRKRSRLEGDDVTSEIVTNGNGAILNHEMNGHLLVDYDDRASPSSLDIPIRGRHRAAKHAAREDGCITWSKNYVYDVKQLPGFPKHLRVEDIEYRATINPNSGYALAVTHEQVLIWRYTSTMQWPEAHVFKLSQAARPGDPVPYASFVTATSTSDTGLLVVNSSTGNITYWENIEDADALSLFEQRRNGMEGSCGTLLYGESVTNLENIEHAGFLLSFSSGRAAQLLVRDTQSKACINVNFLKGGRHGTSSSFLSGLKNVFGGGALMKNIAATRAILSKNRGEMDVIISSSEAQFQFWRLTWSGQASFVAETNALAVIKLVLQSSFGPDVSDASQEIEVLDFATQPRLHQRTAPDLPYDLLVLVSATSANSVRYALVELEVNDTVATTIRTIPIHTYAPDFVDKQEKKARLCIPANSSISYVIFEKAVVLASLARMEPSINTQVLQDSGKLPEPFQDSFDFRADHNYKIIDQAAETSHERSRHSSIILFVQGCGVLRVGATDAPSRDLAAHQENFSSRLSAKAKIEQAIFFGTISNNPLDLSKKGAYIPPSAELEEAALEISEEVLATESPFLPAVAPSMEHHLEQRARVLDQLARHLKDTYPSISREGKWKLLWNAEKLAAARQIWSIYDEAIKGRGVRQLLPEILFLLHENYKTAPNHENEGFDHVRFWFLKNLTYIPVIMPWTYNAIADMNKHGEVSGPIELLDLTSDANDILLAGLETAFSFRTEKAELYGLLNEKMEDGVLTTGFEGLPEFWTSIYQTLSKIQGMFKNARKITKDFIDRAGEEGFPTEEKLMKVMADTPRLVELCCKIYEERARWYLGQPDEKAKHSGQSLWHTYERVRYDLITELSEMGLAQFGMNIAEKHHDLQALVYLVMEESEYAVTSSSSSRKSLRETEELSEMIQLMEKRIRNYFKTYGDEWGDALYSAHLVRDCYTMLLDQSQSYKEEVTRFLRADAKRGKLSWINDVLSEKSFAQAGKTLLDVAVNQEQDVWSKKVELSLAKLALAASDEVPPDSKQARQNRDMQANAMRLVNIQEKLYDHMRPVLYNAMDNAAELQLAMESYGRLSTNGRSSLQQLLERDLERLLVHSTLNPEQLIDILTLMDQKVCELKQDNIAGQEFFLALQVVSSSSLELGSDTRQKLLRMIWRRCYIRDDWKAYHEASHQSDEQALAMLSSTILFRTFYEGYAHSLWEGKSSVAVLEPSNIVGTCVSVEDISGRFPSADISEPLAKDLQDEDQTLRYLIEHCRLEHWVATARAYAKSCLDEEEAAAAAQAKKTKRVEDQLRSEYKDLDSSDDDEEEDEE